jgi:hypothetical protein
MFDGGVWSTSHPDHFTPGEEAYSIETTLGGSQSWSGHFGEEKNILSLLGFELLIIQPVD